MEQAFLQDIQQHQNIIYKVCNLYRDRREDQEDLFQEIVYQLWKAYPGFKGESKLSTWMYRVALNTAIFHLKQTKKRPDTIPFELEMDRLTDERDKAEEDRIKLLYEQIQQLNLIEGIHGSIRGFHW